MEANTVAFTKMIVRVTSCDGASHTTVLDAVGFVLSDIGCFTSNPSLILRQTRLGGLASSGKLLSGHWGCEVIPFGHEFVVDCTKILFHLL